jgi:Domain of unknown function (DUF4394)/PQQ-like domain
MQAEKILSPLHPGAARAGNPLAASLERRISSEETAMKTFTLAAALLATTALAGAAQAETVAALVGDDTIAVVDTDQKKVTKTMKVSGASGKLVGIDVRPADGMLYGVTADGTIWTIDTASGKAAQKSKLDTAMPSGTITVDFNPAADRLRVIGSDGINLRINVDDGKVTKDGNLKFAEGDMHKGKTPKVVAGAYTNSMKGAKETTLYDIDASGAVLRQAPPNDGVLNSVGMLGMSAEAAAFDIVSDGQGGNTGWLMAKDTLYRVDLQTGKGAEVAKIAGVSGTVRDIAVMPKM